MISWRDIPAQVIARNGEAAARAELHRRFQVAIDRAAVKAGLREYDRYIEQWRREARPCGEDLDAEVAAEVRRLTAAYDRARLAGLVQRGGVEEER